MERIKTLLSWIGLFLFGLIILTIFVPLTFLAGIISKFWRRKIGEGFDELTRNLKAATYTIDLMGNVTVFDWVWFLFKTKEGYRFGQVGETISFVLWKNKKENTLVKLGPGLFSLIDFFDPGHFNVFEK